MLVFCSDQPSKGILILYSDQHEDLLKLHYYIGEQMLVVVMVNPIKATLKFHFLYKGFASIPKHM